MNFSIFVEPLLPHDISFSDVSQIQPYFPIYSLFDKNCVLEQTEHVGWNHSHQIVSLSKIQNRKTGEQIETPVFIKYSPLIDPLRYLIGKYDNFGDKIRELPTPKENTQTMMKLKQHNNVSYVDCFFAYLSNLLYNEHQFIHGIQYYGSFLGIKERFRMNVSDDIDFLQESAVFLERLNKTYSMETPFSSVLPLNRNSRPNKDRLKITTSVSNLDVDVVEVCGYEDVPDGLEDVVIEKIYERENHSTRSSLNSSNDSLVSFTTEGNNQSQTDDDNDENDNDENDNDENDNDENDNDENDNDENDNNNNNDDDFDDEMRPIQDSL